VIAALLIGNVLLLVLNIPMIGVFVRLLSVPPMYLLPIVTMVAFVGIYSISHSTFDLYFMIVFGVGGFILRKLEIPMVPIILGLLLGPEMEKNLGHALILSDGDWMMLWSSPLAIGLWLVAGLGLVWCCQRWLGQYCTGLCPVFFIENRYTRTNLFLPLRMLCQIFP